MEKIKLDLENIEAQSFETVAREDVRNATARGFQTEAPTCNVDCTFAINCTSAC